MISSTLKLLIICITIIICVFLFIHFSPYHTFIRECIYNETFQFDLGKEYCTWLYTEMSQENNEWLREMIKLLETYNP